MPGIVPVIIKTDAEKRLGITPFEYIDEMRNMVRQLVHNPKLQGKLFAMWSEELGFLPTGANATHALKQLKEVSDEGKVNNTCFVSEFNSFLNRNFLKDKIRTAYE